MPINLIDFTKAQEALENVTQDETKQILTQILPALKEAAEAILTAADAMLTVQREATIGEMGKFRDETLSQMVAAVGKLATIKIGLV